MLLDPWPRLAYLTAMAVRPILTAPDPRLKAVSTAVEKVDAEIRKLAADMADSMYAADGIGLAAVQIGVRQAGHRDGPGPEGRQARIPRAFINPKILWASEEMATFEEGCLSVPEIWDDVERPARIKARISRPGRQAGRDRRPTACSPPACSMRWIIWKACCSSTICRG